MSMIFSEFRMIWLNSGQLSACAALRTDAGDPASMAGCASDRVARFRSGM